MQALVIAASLRSLVRLPPSTTDPGAGAETSGPSFLQRIWTLLKAEIDEEPGAGDTKVVNLADEVIRVRGNAYIGIGNTSHPVEVPRYGIITKRRECRNNL